VINLRITFALDFSNWSLPPSNLLLKARLYATKINEMAKSPNPLNLPIQLWLARQPPLLETTSLGVPSIVLKLKDILLRTELY